MNKMRFYILLFIFSHFFAGECWAGDANIKSYGRKPSSRPDNLLNSVKEDLNFSIPLPQVKAKGGHYETTPRTSIDVMYKHIEFERSFGLGFTIGF
jgi:hypothetical protein